MLKEIEVCQERTASDYTSFRAYKVKVIKIDCDLCKPTIQVRMATQTRLMLTDAFCDSSARLQTMQGACYKFNTFPIFFLWPALFRPYTNKQFVNSVRCAVFGGGSRP